MKIENQDALKSWLIKSLNPKSESSDPETLARYVMTLIQNDLPEEDLKENCNRELEVFLADVTSFVEDLFLYLHSKAYSYKSTEPYLSGKYLNKTEYCTQWRGDPAHFKNPNKNNDKKKQSVNMKMKELRRQDKSHSNERYHRNLYKDGIRRSFFSPPTHLRSRQLSQTSRKRSQTRSNSRMRIDRSYTPDSCHSYTDLGRRAFSARSSISPASECSAAKRSRVDDSSDRSISPSPKSHKSKNKVKIDKSAMGDGVNENIYCPINPTASNIYPTSYSYPGSVPVQNYLPNVLQPPPSLGYVHTFVNPPMPPPLAPQYHQNNLVYAYVPTRPENYATQHVASIDKYHSNLYAQQPVIQSSPATYNPHLNPQNTPNQLYAPPPQNPEIYAANAQQFNMNTQNIQANTQFNMNTQNIQANTQFNMNTQNIQANTQFNMNTQNTQQFDTRLVTGSQYNLSVQNMPGNFNRQNVSAAYTPSSDSNQYGVNTSSDSAPNTMQYATVNMPFNTNTLEGGGYSASSQFGNTQFGNTQLNTQLNVASVSGNETKNEIIASKSETNLLTGTTVSTENNSLPQNITNTVQNSKKAEHPGITPQKFAFNSNTTLELRRIPQEDNTIANINDHFSKFGIIVNLQVGWNNDSQSALVSFASNAQAMAAYKSKEPFLNNRFIKIFWYNQDSAKTSGSTSAVGAVAGTNVVAGVGISGVSSGVAGGLVEQEVDRRPKPKVVIPPRHQLQLNNTLKKLNPQTLPTAQVRFVPPSTPQNTVSSHLIQSQPQPIVNKPEIQVPGAVSAVAMKEEDVPMETGEAANVGNAEMSEIDCVLAVAGHAVFKNGADILNIAAVTPDVGNLATAGNLDFGKTGVVAKNKLPAPALLKVNNSASKVNDVVSKNLEIRKQKELLLEKSLAQQKSILSCLEKGKSTLPAEEKAKYIKMLKSNEETMNQLKADLMNPKLIQPVVKPVSKYTGQSAYSKPGPATTYIKSSNQSAYAVNKAHKLVRNLDKVPGDATRKNDSVGMEVDAVSGKDTKLTTLSQVGVTQFKSRPKIGRHGRTLDHRPKQLKVTNFEKEDSAELIGHMAIYGEIETSHFNLEEPALFITYKLRQSAEKVAVEGSHFNGRKLLMTWSDGIKKQTPALAPRATTDAAKLPGNPQVPESGSSPAVEIAGKTRVSESETGISPAATSYSLRQGDRRSSSGSQAFNDIDYQVDLRLHNEYLPDEDSSDDDFLGEFDGPEEEDEDGGGRSWRN